MDFNLEKYRNERRAPRTEEFEIKQLQAYFPDGEKPIFTVRGLSAAELARCREAAQRQQDVTKIAGALIGGDAETKAQALKELVQGPEIPNKTAIELEMVHLGCVEPKLEHGDAVLLSEDFPIEFSQLADKIARLTGAGRVLGKPNASGKTTK